MKVVEEFEVKEMLKKYGINVPKGLLVDNLPESIDLEFPVVLKVSDPNILHKTDVGGVVLNIKNYNELKENFIQMKKRFPKSKFLIESMEKPGVEVIIGLINDKTFGLTIMFGLGGIFTELYKDVSFRLIPIDRFDANEMLNEIKAKKIFEGFRNIKVNKDSVIDLLLNVSKFAEDHQNEIDQFDLNPVILREDSAVVVDAKLILK